MRAAIWRTARMTTTATAAATTAIDTLDDAAIRATASRVVHHARAMGRPVVDEAGVSAAHIGRGGVFMNVAVVREQPTDWAHTLAVIADVIPVGVVATLVTPFTTPDLRSAGWRLVGHPPLMARLPGAAAPPPVPAELRIHEVVDRAGLEVFERTLVEGYPVPELQPYEPGRFFDERVLGGPTRLWVGHVDGQPVAAAAGHVAAGVNSVEMVATLAHARGRGYGGAVTWAATTGDASLPAVLFASDLGRPVYERLGYTALTRWTIWYRA